MNEKLIEGIRSNFSEAELNELEECRHKINDTRSFGTLDLLTSWALHVDKIDKDRARTANDPSVWGGYDLVGALSIRDFLSGCIDRLSEPLRKKVAAVADGYDEQFRAVTKFDENRSIERFTDSGLEAAPWWWHRIPNSGPLLVELIGSESG
ncbi:MULTISPECIES: hypothetical protein [Nocardia]|uniref:hypothetical protein n=1 Tax=unclassified Nocardia TaxID=2637762 RepID=UPI003D714A5E